MKKNESGAIAYIMKKLLIIMPNFYGYERVIKDTYEKFGYNVDIVYENYYSVFLHYKILYKSGIVPLEKMSWHYYRNKIKKSDNYSDILVIRGSSVTNEVIEYLKENNPKARFYMYQWDSIQNNQNVLKIIGYFDSIKTFDMQDSEVFGWGYRPLFFVNSSTRQSKRKYNYAYICTNHTERIKIYKELICQYNDGESFIYYYIGLFEYIKNKYIYKNKDFESFTRKHFFFKPISTQKVNSIMSDCSIIVDYTHPMQNGFTMRTIEAIGNRCKLVTNNKNILKSDFYNPNNIYVYDLNEFAIPCEFQKTDYIELDENIRRKYSVEEWCKELIQI